VLLKLGMDCFVEGCLVFCRGCLVWLDIVVVGIKACLVQLCEGVKVKI
jgi:hypothetical protein